jgi:hypothetical protein
MNKERKEAQLDFVTNWMDKKTLEHEAFDEFICKTQEDESEFNKAFELIVILMDAGLIKI